MKYLVMVFFLSLTQIACDSNNTDELADKQKRLVELQASIDSLIADKSCNGVGDCASIAFGSKPCGGPWSYLVYAPSNVDENLLQQLVNEYNQVQDEVNILTNAASDCAFVQEPQLSCESNECKAI
ncbi:MAG: hypothetical protein OER04_14655 [Cyclobacteriaceae bacterium]|nr:hypothetical protein [Cyclobacteriaceae bacterium]